MFRTHDFIIFIPYCLKSKFFWGISNIPNSFHIMFLNDP